MNTTVSFKKSPYDRVNVFACLAALGWGIRYNIRSQCLELDIESSEWKQLTKRGEHRYRAQMEEECKFLDSHGNSTVLLDLSSEKWYRAMEACSKDEDPFKDWLSNLDKWDEIPRLDDLFSIAFFTGEHHEMYENIPDIEELYKWASKSILLAAVHRTMNPRGCKHDEVVVLIGEQGCGKSTFLRALVPEENYFNDKLDFKDDDQRRVEALLGRVIVEISEMRGATTADIESIKSFISRSVDKIRLPWRRNPEDIVRRCVIVGTVNGLHVLPNDSTGNRRFIPIFVEKMYPVKEMWDNMITIREQLWAEALHRYLKGEDAYLPDTLIPAQKQVSKQHRHGNPVLDDAIDGWEYCYVEGDMKTMTDIIKEMNLDIGNRSFEAKYISGKLINERGFTSKHTSIAGKQGRYLFRND